MNFFRLVRNLFTGAGSLGLLAFLVLLAGPVPEAQAAVACSVNAGAGFTRAYNAAGSVAANGSSSFTVTCTRLAGDVTTGDIQVFNDQGRAPSGIQLRAKRTGNCNTPANCLLYNLTRPATGDAWTQTISINQTFNFPSATTLSHTVTIDYGWNIPAPQTVTAGTFTDTVAILLDYDFVAGTIFTRATASSFPVTITTPASCSFTTNPGPVAFGNYNAFTATPGAASTTFAVNCTNTLSYTMALNATSGVAAGLLYTLALSAAAATGTGAAQTHTITGSIPAGQAGTCAAATCTQSVPHSVTITY